MTLVTERDDTQQWLCGTQNVSALAPLDYRYALDAAMPLLAQAQAPLVLCHAPQLETAAWHLPAIESPTHDVALWVEPLAVSWQADLAWLATRLALNGQLIVVLSRPWRFSCLSVAPGTSARWVRGWGHPPVAGALSAQGFGWRRAMASIRWWVMGLSLMGQQLNGEAAPIRAIG